MASGSHLQHFWSDLLTSQRTGKRPKQKLYLIQATKFSFILFDRFSLRHRFAPDSDNSAGQDQCERDQGEGRAGHEETTL